VVHCQKFGAASTVWPLNWSAHQDALPVATRARNDWCGLGADGRTDVRGLSCLRTSDSNRLHDSSVDGREGRRGTLILYDRTNVPRQSGGPPRRHFPSPMETKSLGETIGV